MPSAPYQEYNASLESIKIVPQPTKTKPVRVTKDPLSDFENFQVQVRTDLYNWMTFCEADRIKKVNDFIRNFELAAKWTGEKTDPPTPEERAFYWLDDRRMAAEGAVMKTLNFIIGHERERMNDGSGSREVARLAFLGMFPKVKEK